MIVRPRPLRTPILRCTTPQSFRSVNKGSGTAIIDVEPIVSHWKQNQEDLDRGLRSVLAKLADIPLVFVTNSDRSPSNECTGRAVTFISKARKPFTRLPANMAYSAVIGDQILTDGLLAWRYQTLYIQTPLPPGTPLGICVQRFIGNLLIHLMFREVPHE
jgi:hypothetical protein